MTFEQIAAAMIVAAAFLVGGFLLKINKLFWGIFVIVLFGALGFGWGYFAWVP